MMSEVQDLSHDIGNMTIYEKLARMQNEMHYIGFKKTGSNKFLKAKYFKLDDLLKELIPLTTKYETTLIFSFTSDGVLKLKDWDPEKGEISIRVPFPEFKVSDPNKLTQNIGGAITYLKRYLLMDMFLSMEEDEIEEGAGKKENIHRNNNNSFDGVPKKEVDVDEVLNKIKAHIHKKDSTIQITPVMINRTRMNMFKKKEIDEVESRAVFEWFKKQEKEAKQ
ncbi:ERF family protein [Methanobrevibacter smithii]|uniref:ERF family protein n=1 Tax=Methanobrevibacter smithii TaxID=2173 RepID=UPI00307E0138